MNVLVINGSPKGKYSVTLQTVLYLEKLFPECTFTVLHAAQQVRKFENDLALLENAIREADITVFAYPVYTFLCPSQLHRLIRALHEKGVRFDGKYCTQITTSKHFYDCTAHTYIEDNARDFGFRFIKGLSADMDDLLTEKGQTDAEAFWNYVLFCIKNGICEQGKPVLPLPAIAPFTATADIVPKTGQRDTVIVTDAEPTDTNLLAMIAYFRSIYPLHTRVVNLREFPFAGGCLGCFRCAVTGNCVYKDNFREFLENIQRADACVYAFRIKDHSLGPVFKTYNDRQFCNGHRTVTMGMPVGYIISGHYSQEANLRTVVEARAQVGGNFFCGVACDENDSVWGLETLSQRLRYAVKNQYTQPSDFYGVGGMKIFRDLIYVMRGLMKADHAFYKKNGFYDDLPTRQTKRLLLMELVGSLTNLPGADKVMGNKMNEGMLMPYAKILEKAGEKTTRR